MTDSASERGELPRISPAADKVLNTFVARHAVLRPIACDLARACQVIVAAFSRGQMLFVCGNGGSFADALHIKGELGKAFEQPRPLRDPQLRQRLEELPFGRQMLDELEVGLPVVVLGESHSLRSAYANDRRAEFCYAQELLGLVYRRPEGVLMGISTSGNARDVVAATSLARACRLSTIGLTGPGGGQLADLAEVAIRAPGSSVAEIQQNHLCLYHSLCRMIEAHFFASPG
ncbi:MAG: SIS domain-containing protein [Phycisphaerae bacterium]